MMTWVTTKTMKMGMRTAMDSLAPRILRTIMKMIRTAATQILNGCHAAGR